MDKKVRELLNRWLENGLISQASYEEIVKFEEESNPNQKSKVARAITLIGGLFLLSGLLGTIPLLWMNLAYWAQLGLLVVTTYFLFYAATYSEKLEDERLFIFKSTERVSSFLFLISNISFGASVTFAINILQETGVINFSEEISFILVSFFVLLYAIYLFLRTKLIFQHAALFYCICFHLGTIGNLLFPNIEPWAAGLFPNCYWKYLGYKYLLNTSETKLVRIFSIGIYCFHWHNNFDRRPHSS